MRPRQQSRKRSSADRRPTTDRKAIVVDEFENLPSVEDRRLFAELIKQLSDKGMQVSLIFCGIGNSLDDLLKGHSSAYRYLEEVQLPSPPLSYSGLWMIIDDACKALGLTLNDDSRPRIAQVSDGFPHYVPPHRAEALLGALRAPTEVYELTQGDYMNAVREALGSVESRLRQAYDTATKKDQDSYQEVLWSVADHFELDRNNRRIYDESYQRVMADVGRPTLSFKEFQTRLTNLKGDQHASILSSSRRGWVPFNENLIRGYVRLVAEPKGVSLAIEGEPGPEPKKITAAASSRGVDPSFPWPSFGKSTKRFSRQ